MNAATKVCWLPKAGNAASEFEDAWFLPETGSGRGRRARVAASRPDPAVPFRCAVADGATEASFSGLWARLLTTACGSGLLPATGEGWQHSLPALRAAWLRSVRRRPLPWYAEAKLEAGAFAALCTAAFHSDGRWTAAAVGDSCLFHVRDGQLLTAFPLDRAASFGSRPWLLSSVDRAADGLEGRIRVAAGSWAPGDTAFLMTDALACWFLAEAEAGGQPWAALAALRPGAAFADWIGRLRAARRIRNDDVTLLTIALS